MAATKRSPAEELDVDGMAVRLSNPDKIYFPRLGAAGGTKRHLVEYYRRVATGGELLRALRDRPTHIQRFPDGVEGEEIYQKRVPRETARVCRRVRGDVPVGSHRGRRCGCAAPPTSCGPRTSAPSRSTRGRRAARTSTIPTSCASTSTRSPAPASTTPVGRAGRAASAARRTGPGRVPEDVGRTRTARVHPDRAAVGLHRGTARRRSRWPGGRAAQRRPGDHQVVEGGTRQAHLRRLQSERPGQDHRVARTRRAAPRSGRCRRR